MKDYHNTVKIERVDSNNSKTNTKCKDKPINLSLYSDYNPETTIPNLGFKDEEKALYTIKKNKK